MFICQHCVEVLVGLFLACVRVIVHVCGHPLCTTHLKPASLSKALLRSVALLLAFGSLSGPLVREQGLNFVSFKKKK